MRLSEHFRDIGRTVAYYPSLSDILGGGTATILFCQFFWFTPAEPELNGWFKKSAEEIKKATGLTPTEQRTARRALIERGLLEEEFRGSPPTWHFRLNLDVLDERWYNRAGLAEEEKQRNRERTKKATAARLEKKNSAPSTVRETKGSTVRQTKGSTLRDTCNQPNEARGVQPYDSRKVLHVDKNTYTENKKEREASPLPESLILVLIEVYAETITSQADEVVLQKQAVTLAGKGISVETLRTFFAETELRPARFVAQNLLVWQAARTRQREKQLAESLVGASPEERQRRLALVRGHVSASIAAQPEPEPDVALPDAGRTLWDDVLDVLERSISPEAFATWFRPTRFFAQEGDCLKVQIPDAVFDDWIWNNYAAELEAAMSEAELSDCVVEFVVAERKAA